MNRRSFALGRNEEFSRDGFYFEKTEIYAREAS